MLADGGSIPPASTRFSTKAVLNGPENQEKSRFPAFFFALAVLIMPLQAGDEFISLNRPLRSRTVGGVGAGGEKPLATRLELNDLWFTGIFLRKRTRKLYSVVQRFIGVRRCE